MSPAGMRPPRNTVSVLGDFVQDEFWYGMSNPSHGLRPSFLVLGFLWCLGVSNFGLAVTPVRLEGDVDQLIFGAHESVLIPQEVYLLE